MKRIIKKIRTYFYHGTHTPLKCKNSTQTDNIESSEVVAGRYDSNIADYQDQHRYCRLTSDQKKKIQASPLCSFPLKKVYSCFIWQLYKQDTQKFVNYVDNNIMLKRVESTRLIEGAKQADILILTSGSGIYHIDSFLHEINTSNKMIIIASIRGIESIKQDIKHRIDFHLNKLQLFEQAEFDQFIDHAIDCIQNTNP